MNIQNEKNHVFNIGLANLIGLYNILDPGTIQFRGQKVFHVVITFIMLCSWVISMILNVSGVYYLSDNLPISIEYFWFAENTIFIYCKVWIMFCLSIMHYGFIAVGLRNFNSGYKKEGNNINIHLYNIHLIKTFFLNDLVKC